MKYDLYIKTFDHPLDRYAQLFTGISKLGDTSCKNFTFTLVHGLFFLYKYTSESCALRLVNLSNLLTMFCYQSDLQTDSKLPFEYIILATVFCAIAYWLQIWTEEKLYHFSIHLNQFSHLEGAGIMFLRSFGTFNHYTV